jgi:hypothetical protein
VAVLIDVLRRVVSLVDSLLSGRVSNASSVRLMEHAATLDLVDFEDAYFQDRLERARRQTCRRMALISPLLSKASDTSDREDRAPADTAGFGTQGPRPIQTAYFAASTALWIGAGNLRVSPLTKGLTISSPCSRVRACPCGPKRNATNAIAPVAWEHRAAR